MKGTTLEVRKALRRKPLWRVGDFAAYMGLSQWQARSVLLRYNEAIGGMLLRPSSGTNRGYTFYWAALAKHDPDAFLDDPIETQARVDALEDGQDLLRDAQRMIVAQTGQNSRDIARLKRLRRNAA